MSRAGHQGARRNRTRPRQTATVTDQPAETQPDTTDASTDGPPADDDQSAALDRSAEAIREAKDAEGTVAAHDDITAADEDRSGEASQDPEGEGGMP